MQNIFLDIPAGAWKRNPELTDWLEHGQAQTGLLRQHGYDRVLLRTENLSELYDLLETVIFQESMHWILQEEGSYYRHLLEPEAYDDFQRQAKRRIEKMEPQLRGLIRRDLERMLPDTGCFNVSGYLRFSAKRLKRLLQRLLQEEYHRLESELEQEEFVELLRFFISVQPPLLEQAYLTLYGDHFTLTDGWGNDLRQIYLESLSEEEITGVNENDLIMSILITLLPRTIYLEVKERPKSGEFLVLLQRVFGEQMVWQKAERT
mgnify:FL=1